ncbi:hypothetical protein [Chitinophaga sp.]|uniref:hypothetical protein n=1 Tax=Chitinophaga sp. TaxID=1869181 RepID=UPI002CCDDCF2|nr:hypothetical protein [Chitinophaga sp.]HWV69525.1 hypothetical protein [Chitinophaga sp.]
MKYVNPVIFLEAVHGGPVDTGDTAALSLLRKKMLAELELSDDKQFKTGEWAFDKHQLLQFFDQLTAGDELFFHAQVAADPVLLHFLDTGEITGRFADNPVYENTAFLVFISPWYGPLFANAVIDSLKHQQLQQTIYLFANPWLMDGEHTTTSYRKIFRYMQIVEEHLKAIIGKLREGATVPWQQILVFANITLVQQLNALPSGFREWRSEYGISLINLGLAIYRNDFKNGMAMLELVEKLHTAAYVKEETERWKAKMLAYGKEQRANRSLAQRIGSLLGPLKPKGMSEEGTGTLVIIISAILLSRLFFSLIETKPRPAIVTSFDYFAHDRTYEPVKYLLYHLQTDSIYPLNNKDSSKTPVTGDDVYGPDFMTALNRPFSKTNDPAILKIAEQGQNASHASPKGNTVYRQSLHLYNRLIAPAIALVQTPDTFYSCYISPGDSAYVPLQLAVNRLYVYIGQQWNGTKQAQYPMDDVKAYRVKGFFVAAYKNSRQFLKENSLIFKLDPTYWATSNRNIPIEIGLSDSTYLHFNLLENNAAGVELEVGD